MDATKEEILNRLKVLGLDKKKPLANALKMSERTTERWFQKEANFPNWFLGFLHLLEENHLQTKKIEVLEQELKLLKELER
ncbi:MAG: hypothetical protein AB7D96_02430 [Arcobacteraceae bacterium]